MGWNRRNFKKVQKEFYSTIFRLPYTNLDNIIISDPDNQRTSIELSDWIVENWKQEVIILSDKQFKFLFSTYIEEEIPF